MLGTFLTILLVILGIAVSIGLHELGHFIPAKLFKVPTTEYFIGFGPTIFSIFKGETEYGLKAIPMGGYTRIEGMFPPAPDGRVDKHFKKQIVEAREESLEGMQDYDQSRAFYWLSSPKKLIVMMGGTLTNLVLGFLCFVLAFAVIGGPGATTTIASVSPGSPAQHAGISPDDTIIQVNQNPTPEWSDVVREISQSPSFMVDVTYLHQGQEITKSVEATGAAGEYKIGIGAKTQTMRLSVVDCLYTTFDVAIRTAGAIATIPAGMFDAVVSLVTNTPRTNSNLVSVVGLGQIAVSGEKQASGFWMKFANTISLLGSLNIALFVFNLIPLLPLDGGHSANAIYEGIKRLWAKIRKKPRPAPADLARTMPLAYFIYGFMIAMFVIMVLADVFHPIV